MEGEEGWDEHNNRRGRKYGSLAAVNPGQGCELL